MTNFQPCKIKKALIIIAIMGSSSLLSACGDENPLLKEPFKQDYTDFYTSEVRHKKNELPCKDVFCKAISQSKLVQDNKKRMADNLSCPYYFKAPEKNVALQSTCEPWIKKKKEYFQNDQNRYADNHGLEAPLLTDEDVRDPVFWTVIVDAMEKEKLKEKK